MTSFIIYTVFPSRESIISCCKKWAILKPSNIICTVLPTRPSINSCCKKTGKF